MMNINFTFKNFDPSVHLKGYARKRFEKLGKFISKTEKADLNIILMVEKFRHKAEVVLTSGGLHISALESSEDMYSSVDMVLDKVEAQLRKVLEKTKQRDKAPRGGKVQMNILSYEESAEGRVPVIEQTDEYQPKPMDAEEAAMQLETLDHEFLVFRNAETETINVIYKRKNGDFGLIDPGK